MNEIIFFHSARNPISSILEFEKFVRGISPLEDIASIIILTIDNDLSIPKGIQDFQHKFQSTCKFIKVDKLDPSEWTGREDPETFWADSLEEILNQSEFINRSLVRNFILNIGDGWNTAILYFLSEIIDGKIWIKINENQNLNLTRKSQNENQKVLFGSIGKFFSENPDENSFIARDLIGSGAISAKGVENSLRNYDDLFSSFSEGKDKHYFVNQIGRYNFLLNYSSKLSNSSHDNNKRGLIVFSRTNDDPTFIKDYLQEHRTNYDVFSFVSMGYDNGNSSNYCDLVQSAEDILGSRGIISSKGKEIIMYKNNRDEILDNSIQTIRKLNQIREANPEYEWAVDITRTLAIFRPTILQYCFISRIKSLYFTNIWSDGKSVFESGLSKNAHTLSLPEVDDLLSIRNAIKYTMKDSSMEFLKFLITIYTFHKDDGKTGMILENTQKSGISGIRIHDYNREAFANNQQLIMGEANSSNAYNICKRYLKRAEDFGLIEINAPGIELNSLGKIVACLLLSQFRS